jgi:tetratricopeptide (TPR) repeat protein
MPAPSPPCPSENELADYVGHAPGAAAVEPHLDACPVCRATVARLLALASGVDDGDAPGPPAEDGGGLLSPGARVGRYEVVDLVGAGAMGTVYAARDPELRRTVALKLLRPELGRGPRAAALRARLAREARVLARISHPNVITVYDTGAVGDQIFVAMELVAGGTLRAWAGQAPRSWQEILDAYLAAGRGLAAAHAAGVVHRDFKPDNVLVGADGRVRVTDFGLSRVRWDDPPPGPEGGADRAPPSRSTTSTHALAGTPVYMAPEQLAGGEADARSDLFSFCVALHEALYGARPFAGSTVEELRASVRAPVPDPPPGARVPRWIRRVLVRGLAADPAARYPSMAALIDALARDPGRMRRRAGVAAIGALLVAAAAASGWSARARAPICEGSAERVAGVWDAARRDAGARAFAATGAPDAEGTWQRAAGAIDAWAAAWVAMRREACVATRVRGEQPEALLGRRMACLDRRLEGARATVDLLLHADAEVVRHAVRMTEALPRVAECADSAALLAPVAPPPPEAEAKVAAVRAQIDRAAALRGAGRFEEARRTAEAALGEAKGVGYGPLIAEAQLRAGIAQADLGHYAPAAEALLEATLAAEAAHDDAVAARAWLEQVHALARGSRFDEAHRAAKHAAALVARVGGGDALEAGLERVLGLLAEREGHYAEAAAHHRRDLEIRERIGERGVSIGNAHTNLAMVAFSMGDLAQAEAEDRAAVRIYTEALGPRHLDVVMARRDLATVLADEGKRDDGIAELRALLEPCEDPDVRGSNVCIGVSLNLGLELLEAGRAEEALAPTLHALEASLAANGPEDRLTAKIRTNLGEIYLDLGRLDEAGAEEERAIHIKEKLLGEKHPELCSTRNLLGDVRRAQGRTEEAVALHRRSLDDLTAALGPDSPRLAGTLVALGEDDRARGRAADALASCEHALALVEKADKRDEGTHADALTCIGRAKLAAGAAHPAPR